MSKGVKKIAIQLLGLNKSQVDRHMQNLIDINNDKLSEIKGKIQTLIAENEKLLQQINCLTEEAAVQKKSQEIINFGLKKSEKIELLVNKAAKDEVDALSSEWREKELELNNEINEYSTIIHNTKENIEKLLQNVMISNDSVIHIIKTQPDIIAENKEIIEPDIITEDEEIIEHVESNFWGDDLEEKEFEAGKGIEMEITQIKNNYLIGKIVGEDILDNNGDIIVHKNEHITEEIINAVEKEGKLVDLILNMEMSDKTA